MSQIAPPPAPSRQQPSLPESKDAPKPKVHPLPANPMHHQGFIKQQVKNAAGQQYNHQNSHLQQQRARYPNGSANGVYHVNALPQPYASNNGAYSSSGTSGSSSMYSAISSSTQPSPATSSTSSVASSLRTPPDFLMHTAAGLSKPERPGKVFLSIEEINQRLQLLDTLTSDLTPVLPPGPASYATSASQARSPGKCPQDPSVEILATSKLHSPAKQTAHDSSKLSATSDSDKPTRKRLSAANDELPSFRKKIRPELPSTGPTFAKPLPESKDPTTHQSPLLQHSTFAKRQWTKDEFSSTGNAYQSLGRTLKHSADDRTKGKALDEASRDPKNQLTALFESTEAILCFTYAFWCEDQALAAPRSCIASNWSSLLGLLHYARSKHDQKGLKAFSGLCRFLEAIVLQHLANNEKTFVQQQLSSMAAAEQEGDALPSSLPQLSASMNKALVDEETSRQLLVQARKMLSPEDLSTNFPGVWAVSNSMRSSPKAKEVDPNAIKADGSPKTDSFAGRWAWPLDSTVSFPHIVCFGRALLRESAQQQSLQYRLSTPPQT